MARPFDMSNIINGIPFTEQGFIDIPAIKKQAPEAVFFWLIGSRQVGKTYGVSDYLYSIGARWLFLRHNAEELKMANTAKINMFLDKGLPWAGKTWNEEGKPTMTYSEDFQEGKIPFMISTNLHDAGKVRGMPVAGYDHIFFDEFIPINRNTNRYTDGKDLQDIYMTVNSVREAAGRPPVEMWCCANSNSLASPILAYWGLTQEFLNMARRGQGFKYIPARRLCLVNCSCAPVSKDLARGALFQCLGTDNDFAKMALENHFVDDDAIGVKSCPVKEYKLQFKIDDLAFYLHKNRPEWYIVERATERAKKTFTSTNPTSYAAFKKYWSYWGLVTPVDGETIFYNSYLAKIKAYKLLNLG